jgi:hypothetical protein
MKKHHIVRFLAVAIGSSALALSPARAEVLLEENFTFTGLLTANGWTAVSATNSNAITAAAPGLIYPNLPSSGVGNAAALTTSGEDDRKSFSPTNTTGDIYTSFLVNVSAAQAAGDYFTAVGTTVGGSSSFFSRVFAKSSGSGFQLGIQKASTAPPAYFTNDLQFNTTYLVVTKLTRAAGAGVASLWVNPALGAMEPAPQAQNSTGSDAANIDSVYLRQGSAANAATLRVGSILVGTTWASVTPASSASAPLIASFTPSSGQVGATVTINGSNFGATPAVKFNGIAAASSVNPAGTEITATVPSGATTGPITVEVAGEPIATSATNFTVVDPLAPTLSTAGTLTSFTTEAGTASASQNFTVSGSNLTGNVTVTAPAGFEVSADNTTFGATASLVPVGGSLSDVPAYVRISATALLGAVSGNVAVSATGAATQNVAVSGTVTAGISYVSITSTNANSYVQNFNSLGTTTIAGVISRSNGVQTSLGAAANSALNGWYAAKIAGTGSSTTGIVANDGSANAGAVYNYGSTNTEADANLDRSLGALSSGGVIPGFGALIKNDTTNTLTALSITMTAKFWRSSTSVTNVLTFGYGRLDGTNTTDSNFLTASNGVTAFPDLNVVGPAPVATNAALNGNDITNQRSFNGIVVPVSLAPGQTAFIRWQDANDAGNDAGLAIDDFIITAVAGALVAPEFDLPAGVYLDAQTVRVSNFASYGPGVEVRYTLDGSTPGAGSLLYNNTSGIAIAPGNGTITLRAVAINTGSSASSAVASVAYTMPQDVANLTALRASPTGSTIYRVTGEVTFTAGTSFRNTKFFQDAGAGIQIDDPGTTGIITTTYVAGDNVQNIMGRISTFNGQLQMVPLQDFGAPVSSGNVVTPLSRTIATLSNADQAMLVTMVDVEFEQAGTPFGAGGSNTPITDPSVTGFAGVCRNIFGESNITGSTIPFGPNTLTGIVQSALVNTVPTLTVGPRSLSDIVFTGTPSLSISTDKTTLVAGVTSEATDATVTITRTGSTASELVIDLTQDVANALTADLDGLFVYTPLPAQVTMPIGAASRIIYLAALPSVPSFNVTLTVSADTFDPVTQTFSVQGSGGGNAYDTWASDFGLDPATNGAPTADPDGDSFTNAQEYAFGTNPTQGTGSLLSSTASGGNLVVTWLQRSDVTYNVQSTGNLSTSFANDGTVSVVDGPVSPTPPAGYTSKQFTVPASGSKFYRVTAATQ